MKVFISHKQQDSVVANRIAQELRRIRVDCYLDLLDNSILKDGKSLTDHIKKNLNDCTDIIVVMSEITRFSQWVPFEVGMAAQVSMPTATFLKEDVVLPEFLQYWPRLKQYSDLSKYVSVRKNIDREYYTFYETAAQKQEKTERFYNVLKEQLR